MPKAVANNTQAAAIRSKHRLAEISHHFLSDANERLPAWENTAVIPILLGSKNDDYVVYELDRAFNHQNSSSIVLNIENRLTASASPEIFLHSGEEESSLPDYCLVPVSSPSTTLALQSDRLVIAVHASLGGVRIAYDQLAFLAALDTKPDVCVIMLGAKSKPAAKRFFGFLCDSAQSLLSLKLECGGYLLQAVENHSGGKTTEPNDAEIVDTEMDGDIATTLEGVAADLLQKFTPGKKRPAASVTRLAAPAGPAALLS